MDIWTDIRAHENTDAWMDTQWGRHTDTQTDEHGLINSELHAKQEYIENL